MAETNGHAPELATTTASAGELDALLQGLFEPVPFEIAPGRTVEIRPLILNQADDLYTGGNQGGARLQRYLLARCVYVNDRPLGDALAATLPIALANKLVPVVMAANGMEVSTAAEGEGEATDPKV